MAHKILIVDDEPDIIKSLTGRLEREKYEVVTAQDGYHATQTALKELPDCIVLDIGMPSGNGHEVVRHLRRCEATKGIPVIFLTGKSSNRDYLQAAENGVARYFTKPFQAEKVVQAIGEVIADHEVCRTR